MRPPHPGALVREEILEPHGLSVTKAAAVLGVRRATLSDLIHQKVSLTPEMALRIEKAFGIGMETLLNMQAWHDAFEMRERADEIKVEPFETN
ncbi:HigA family addiction module antitoxin [Breoghania sp. JC706]|uniref:HigA family addiction module antitoxin n=1 Tax=Breoghania sp. JC706 TaxID=3117732 RepID=UPI00300A1F99